MPKFDDFRSRFEKEKAEVTPLFKQRILTLLGGALGLIAALAWNDAVQSLFRELFPVQAHSIAAKFGYAIFLTAIVVYTLLKVERILMREEKK